MDPYPRGPDWMPITPKTGSLFHAESHFIGLATHQMDQESRNFREDFPESGELYQFSAVFAACFPQMTRNCVDAQLLTATFL